MRVNGSLAVSRALGDFEYKKNPALPAWEQCVSPLPDVVNHTLSETDEFLVLACDGIWNVMTGQQVTHFTLNFLQFFGARFASFLVVLRIPMVHLAATAF